MGRVDLFEKIVKRFLATRVGDPGLIREAIARGQIDVASTVAHSAISTAGSLGAEQLALSARALQQALDDSDPGDVAQRLAHFSREHAAVAQALQTYLDRREPSLATAGQSLVV
jgi:HPt (histidine-containing phosphotransfer) domain-containing protein